jgi:hypothetical protein
MVLPHRIELWTSPLPRECSTTELRQRPEAGVAGRKASLTDGHYACTKSTLRGSAAILATGWGLSASAVTSTPGMTRSGLRHARPRALTLSMAKPGKTQKWAARSARLSAALRENLKRRKAQARKRELERELALGGPSDGQSEGDSSPRDAQTGASPEFRRNPVRE